MNLESLKNKWIFAVIFLVLIFTSLIIGFMIGFGYGMDAYVDMLDKNQIICIEADNPLIPMELIGLMNVNLSEYER